MLTSAAVQMELDRLLTGTEYAWIASVRVYEVVAATGGWQVDCRAEYRRRVDLSRRTARNRSILVAGAEATTVAAEVLRALEERLQPRRVADTSG